ncbi:MAG: hypothetical protein N2255_10680, partial [Kiritimatiellae bacterium]|nr:hypothetical protein [Kiritimatiellia bacterium]
DQGELPLWTEVLCAEREKVIERLRRHGIIAKALPPSLHRSKHLGVGGRFRNADFYGKCGMILPCGPGQSARNLKRVVEVLWKMRREVERM